MSPEPPATTSSAARSRRSRPIGLAGRIADTAAAPSPGMILGGALVLLAADQAYRHVGGDGLRAGGLDETAHLMTGFLLLAALFRRAPRDFSLGLLVASVAIDADHIPQHLGTDVITVGTARPYSHSLLTVAVLLVLALNHRWRRSLLGGAVGVIGHFGRDMCENHAGVPLLWPFTDHCYTAPPAAYFVVVTLLAATALIRASRSGHGSAGLFAWAGHPFTWAGRRAGSARRRSGRPTAPDRSAV